jgi:hypothetical protein
MKKLPQQVEYCGECPFYHLTSSDYMEGACKLISYNLIVFKGQYPPVECPLEEVNP